MKINELRQKNPDELREIARKERDTLRNFRFQVGQGKVKNNKAGRMMRKTIARISTLLRENA
ncbi:MAG: 50S ribosomal protein L29 [Candidatus Niyogibacteria bacterium]|nr:50S ribosomal protein L29 [Candidatus Niyogibacteria bacterium]